MNETDVSRIVIDRLPLLEDCLETTFEDIRDAGFVAEDGHAGTISVVPRDPSRYA